MRFSVFLLLAALVMVGCQDIFEPEIGDVDPFLVVEGRINTHAGTNYIFMYNSMPYTDHPYFVGQTGAIVKIEDEGGNFTYFDDIGNGAYKLVFTEESAIQIGDIYKLKILTKEGDVYESTPQLVVPSPEINSFFCQYDHNTFLTENAYGSPLEIELAGINIIHETDGILPADNLYMYEYSAWEQHHTIIQIGISFYDLYRHRRLSGRYGSTLHTVNADEYGNFKVRGEELMFIARDDMTNYIPKVADTIIIMNTRFEGVIFRLKQYSISPDVYNYYSSVEDQLLAEGRMFDPASPQVVGNISCITDSTKHVIGVFSASDVALRENYFHVNSRGNTYSKRLDSLPELWMDTCSWGRPESWIIPPF